MNDDRLERELHSALLEDDPGTPPEALRDRIRTIPDAVTAPTRPLARWRRSLPAMASAALVVVLAGLALAAIGLRVANVGPSVTPGLSPSGSPPSSSSSTPAGTTPPTSEAPTPSASLDLGAWGSLSWSAPGVFPGEVRPDALVSFDGALYAVGQGAASGGGPTEMLWRSSDGLDWTALPQAGQAFADAQINGLVATADGLVAWGITGQPSCTGQGAGEVCGPTPISIWTSPDGEAWTPIADTTTFADAYLTAMVGGPHGLVAVGNNAGGAPLMWASPTGSAWTRVALPATFARTRLTDIEVARGTYLLAGSADIEAAGSLGLAATSGVAAAWWSPDGRTWQAASVQRQGGVGQSLGTIFVGAEGLVAVGSADGTKTAAAWTSADDKAWQPIALASAGPSPTAGEPTLPCCELHGDGAQLVAVQRGDGNVLRYWASRDGVTWTPLSLVGATDTQPVAEGDPDQAARGLDRLDVVPGGVLAFGFASGAPGSGVAVWRGTALP